MAETNRHGRGNLCELRILVGERGRRFRPYKKVGLVHGRGQADAHDFLEVRGVRLKPIRRIRFHLRKIELHGAREMMSLRLWHQAGAAQRGDPQNCRRGSAKSDARARRQHIRGARPYKERVETRREKREPVDSRDGRELKQT